MDLRHKLGLLVLEDESEAAGLVRITLDQEQRTRQRLEGQIKTAKERAPKKSRVKREPKVKVPKVPKIPKPRKPRTKKGTKTHTATGVPRGMSENLVVL